MGSRVPRQRRLTAQGSGSSSPSIIPQHNAVLLRLFSPQPPQQTRSSQIYSYSRALNGHLKILLILALQTIVRFDERDLDSKRGSLEYKRCI